MRNPYEGTYRISQGFNDPCCRDSYKKFGLVGHNGRDIACPTGTKILAPHDGKVIEATLDPNGYGIYVKIENSVEGSVLAHLREYRVGVGDGVKEGDLIGYSDNSGNSTGAHLHWGYYRFPRDRQNGFAGFIDQTPYIGQQNTQPELQVELDKVRAERDANYNKFVVVCEALGVGANVDAAVNEAKKLVGNDDALVQKDKQIQEANTKITDLETELSQVKADNATHLQEASVLTSKVAEYEKTVNDSSKKIESLLTQVNELKNNLTIDTLEWWELIKAGVQKFMKGR